MLEFSVTLQVTFPVPLVLVHPLQEEKLFPLAVDGAVRVYWVPEAAVSVNGVLASKTTLFSGLPTVMLTPLAGFVESTVSV